MKPMIFAALTLLGLCVLWVMGFGSAAVLLACIAACVLCSCILAYFALGRISVSVQAPTAAQKGETIEVLISADIPTHLPIGDIRCKITARNRLTGEQEQAILRLPTHSKNAAQAKLLLQTKHCGYTQLRVDSVQALDWFGLVPGPKRPGGSAAVTVMPELFSMQVYPDVPASAPEDSVEYADDRVGNDYSETYQLREYREGDSLRAIHWKLTAKQDRLIVRDPAYPISKSLLVFWDKRGDAQKLDAMADVAASLIHGLLDAGLGFHFGWMENEKLALCEIIEEEDFLRTVPMSIRSQSDGDIEKAIDAMDSFGKIIYIGTAFPVVHLTRNEKVACLLTDEADSDEFRCIHIPLTNYQTELQTLEL